MIDLSNSAPMVTLWHRGDPITGWIELVDFDGCEGVMIHRHDKDEFPLIDRDWIGFSGEHFASPEPVGPCSFRMNYLPGSGPAKPFVSPARAFVVRRWN